MTTVTINERTASGKQLIAFLKTLPDVAVIDTKRRTKPGEDSPYDPAFVKEIQESRQQVKEGKGKKIKTADLWK